jgi:hypothetical protein
VFDEVDQTLAGACECQHVITQTRQFEQFRVHRIVDVTVVDEQDLHGQGEDTRPPSKNG